MSGGKLRGEAHSRRTHRVLMLLENLPYPKDVRVRREALALVAAGHQVTVAAPRASGEKRRETVDGVRVERFRLAPAAPTTRGLLREYAIANVALHASAVRGLLRGVTVLHLHNPPDTLFPAAFLARVLRRRVVFDHHDLFPELVEARIGMGPWRRAARLAERLTFAAASHVLAANESHAQVARERGHLSAERITVVRNGPPAASLTTSPAVRPGRLEDPVLLYLGFLASQDGGELLADLLVRLTRDHGLSRARLIVVGDGDERQQLEAALATGGVADRAAITGWVAEDAVRTHLARADICIDPSPPTALNERSTMIKVGEYLAAAKPVVAYDLLETRRTTGDAARLVRPGDAAGMAAAIAELAADESERLALARAAVQRAPELTWEHSVEALLRVYATL
jgi:glycosyltransferase involved in cell wall biosynthesis